jgi:hypothetical protein
MMKLPPEIEIWSGQAKKHASDPPKKVRDVQKNVVPP